MLRGPHTSFPVAGYSQRQGCVSHSTPEAELVALDSALRKLGVPGLLIWDTILPHVPALMCHDDNQPMIRVLQTGRNPSMRYLHRTHRVSVRRLHEAFKRRDFELIYELTSRMCADIYTKAFSDSGKWEAACELINIVDPKWLDKVILQRAAQEKGGYG